MNTGMISMSFMSSPGAYPWLDTLNFLGTGCASTGLAMNYLTSIDEPLIRVQLSDGSNVEFEFMVTESFSMLGGTFWFEDGPCAGLDGMFYLFH